MELNLEMNIDRRDLQVIKDNMDNLTDWLVSNYTSISAVGLVLDTIIRRVDEIEKFFDEGKDSE